jgi:carbamoyl-phosphate synthase small subunit
LSFIGVDYVKEVTHKKEFRWDEKDGQSAEFDLVRGGKVADARNFRKPLPPADIPIVAFDYGMKYNILRRLRQHGFATQVLPATAGAAGALKHKPAGIFLSNGPGDPAALDYIVREVKTLLDTGIPDFRHLPRPPDSRPGVRRKTFKLKFGHRGGNQPVKDLESGRVEITSQNHGFAVDAKSLPSDFRAPDQFERPDRRRHCGTRPGRFSACNIIPKPRPARMIRRRCSPNSALVIGVANFPDAFQRFPFDLKRVTTIISLPK